MIILRIRHLSATTDSTLALFYDENKDDNATKILEYCCCFIGLPVLAFTDTERAIEMYRALFAGATVDTISHRSNEAVKGEA